MTWFLDFSPVLGFPPRYEWIPAAGSACSRELCSGAVMRVLLACVHVQPLLFATDVDQYPGPCSEAELQESPACGGVDLYLFLWAEDVLQAAFFLYTAFNKLQFASQCKKIYFKICLSEICLK